MIMAIFMLMYSLPEKAGGITSVMLNRSKMLAERGINSNILTLDNKNYDDLRDKLLVSGRLHQNVEIINLYEQLEKENDISSSNLDSKNKLMYQNLDILMQEGYYVQANEYEKLSYARYFKDNQYVMYKKWMNGKLSHVDFFKNRKRIKRQVFKNQTLRKELYFDDKNQLSEENFFSNDGFAYLSYWYNGNGKVVNVFLFNKKSKKVMQFKNNTQFHAYWMDCYLKENDVLILDGIGTYPKVEAMKRNDIKKIFTIHTNHFEFPYEYGAQIKTEFKKLLNGISKINKLVVLTEEQKVDIIKQFGDYHNIEVIPNVVEYSPSFRKVDPDNNSIVVLQRYVKMKNLDHIIKAMKIVSESVPNAKLHLYGDGPEKENYISLIENLNLENNVFVHDYAFNLEKIYNESSLSVLTSEYEAQSMSIIEAMNYGVPVISYPINYGPESIIRSNIDGIILKEKNNVQELSDNILEILKDNKLRHSFIDNARSNIKENYSYESVAKKWETLVSRK